MVEGDAIEQMDGDADVPCAEDAVDLEAEAVDIEEFEDYKILIPIAAFPSLVLVGIAHLILHKIGLPGWCRDILIGTAWMTMPVGIFAIWMWHQPAVRLPNGKILQRDEAKALALKLCGYHAVSVAFQIFRPQSGALSGAAGWVRQRLLFWR
ncbi:MAG: hypothetical protein J7494_00790 [Sphingobium sp.]|nr:hypothetical protein [Sphingobium sp.]